MSSTNRGIPPRHNRRLEGKNKCRVIKKKEKKVTPRSTRPQSQRPEQEKQ